MTKIDLKNRHSIYLFGGLGNQLFQLCKAIDLENNYPKSMISLNFKLNYDRTNLYEYLPLDGFDLVDKKSNLAKIHHSINSRLLNPFIKYDLGSQQNNFYKCNIHYGFFQRFSLVKDKIDLIQSIIEKSETCLTSKANFNFEGKSIAIHVRQGDYLNLPKYQVLDADYYLKSVRYLIQKNKNIDSFTIYSDSTLKSNVILKQLTNFYPSFRIETKVSSSRNDLVDLIKMASHENLVCANSTFSWWAGVLNRTMEKNIVRPKKYFSDNETPKDLYPVAWKAI